MKVSGFAVACAVALLFVGCSQNPVTDRVSGGDPEQKFGLSKSLVERKDASATDEMISEQAASNNRFAVNLYKELIEGDKNLFFSPYSITCALAMTAAGAVGETKDQILDALEVTLSGNGFDEAINTMDLSFKEHSEATEGLTLNVVNSTWMQSGWPFSAGFLDHLSRYYGAGVNMLDFISQSEESRIIINDWVAEQTNQKILDLLPGGTITYDTRLVLTNAVYFLADWKYGFDPELTNDGNFILLDGSHASTPYMYMNNPDSLVRMPYSREYGARAMEFSYKGDRLSMVVLLPEKDNFVEFENALTLDTISTMIALLDSVDIQVALPKFKFSTASISLVKPLKNLGMEDAFVPGLADFSDIGGAEPLYISDVAHKAFISVDEQGTEAAAATGVVVSTWEFERDDFRVTRPFIYIIRDRETENILFMGRVLNPAVEQ